MPRVTEKLRYPSVLEAVCELRFASSDSYTMIPGAMKERLLPRFPSHEVLPAATLMGVSRKTLLQHRFHTTALEVGALTP